MITLARIFSNLIHSKLQNDYDKLQETRKL